MMDSHIPMFEGTLINMATNRIGLLYWCKFYYQNIFSVDPKERPDDFTVNYDILLDEWLEKKSFTESSNTSTRPRASASDMDHVITFDN